MAWRDDRRGYNRREIPRSARNDDVIFLDADNLNTAFTAGLGPTPQFRGGRFPWFLISFAGKRGGRWRPRGAKKRRRRVA